MALDAATGKKLWQTFTILEAAKPTHKNPAGTQQLGPSGAGMWSRPTIDEQLGVLYVATGDNYSDPPTDTSDAILAMELKTGELLWSKQLTENDAFNTACEPSPGRIVRRQKVRISISDSRRFWSIWAGESERW